jgi:hypothetical protein
MSRPKGIIAYGKDEDRLKLAAVARHEGKSGSEFIVDSIRVRYQQLFGDLPPELTKGDE